MILRSRHIALIVVAALAAPATAVPLDTVRPPSARERDEAKIVCKTQAKTGTRFRNKDCRTQGQWEELRDQQQLEAKEMLNRPVICGGGGSPEGC